VARNSLFSITGQFAIKVISFIFMVYVVRRLGDDNFGKYSFVLAYVGLFSVLSDLGIGAFAVREIAKDKTKTSYLISNIVLLRLILSVITVFMVTTLAGSLGYSNDVVWGVLVHSCALFLYAVLGPFDAVWIGNERLDYSAALSVIHPLVFVALGAPALLRGYGFMGLILASFVGVAVMTAMSAAVAIRKFGRITLSIQKSDWNRLIMAALPFGAIHFFRAITYKVDTVLLSLFQTDAVVGWYSVACNLIFTLMIIAYGINLALYPALSRRQAQDPASIGLIHQRTIKYLLMLSLPIAMGTTLLADKIITFLYTAEFSPAIPALRILIWVLPMLFLSDFSGYVAIVNDKERAAARVVATGALVNVVSSLLLIPNFGLLGASMATILTEIVILTQYYLLLRKELISQRTLVTFVTLSLAAVAMGTIILLIRNAQLFLLIGVGIIVYTGIVIATGSIDKSELQVVARMLTGKKIPAATALGAGKER